MSWPSRFSGTNGRACAPKRSCVRRRDGARPSDPQIRTLPRRKAAKKLGNESDNFSRKRCGRNGYKKFGKELSKFSRKPRGRKEIQKFGKGSQLFPLLEPRSSGLAMLAARQSPILSKLRPILFDNFEREDHW